jgi:hypothetical protein
MSDMNKIAEKYDDDVRNINSVRSYRNKLSTNSINKRPFIGSYYWLPTMDNRWILDNYFYQNYGDTRHERVWNMFVIPYLSELWDFDIKSMRRKLKDCFTGLPRGMVSKNEEGKFVIYHGGDFIKRGWENKILKTFNIKKKAYEFVIVDHMRTTSKDEMVVRNTLSISS